MDIFEIIGGALLLACAALLIFFILQQTSRGKGLSGALGGSMDNMYEGRARTGDAMLVKLTSYIAVAFFVLAIGLGAINFFLK